jgi:ABC-2 type transport system ATP-binding protein
VLGAASGAEENSSVAMPDGVAILARDLTKTFRVSTRRPGLLGAARSLVAPEHVAKTAVDRVSFSVRRGELAALLGPNGAGKSTAIKMLTGVLVPTSGEVLVAGLVPHRDREHNARNIGAVFGQRSQLWWDLPARESLSILRDIFEVDDTAYRQRLRDFDDLLGLSEFWNTPVRHLSLGQRVRCDLAAALLHDPAILYLDEPTIGMDLVVKEQVRQFLLHRVRERGATVLLTTHDIMEVARLTTRTILINHGRVIFDGSHRELQRRFGGVWKLHVTFAEPMTGPPPRGLRVLHQDGVTATFGPDGQDGPTPQEAAKQVIEHYQVSGISIEENDLEDVIRATYLEGPDVSAQARAAEPAAQPG